jgi:hypothetical protein
MGSVNFDVAMQYLHAIGRIVFLKRSKLIFPDPSIATQTAAKFVSPEEVRARLLGTEGVEILAKEQVGYLLNVAGTRLLLLLFLPFHTLFYFINLY